MLGEYSGHVSPGESHLTINRDELPYENLSTNFHLEKRDFGKQYAVLYASRLATLKPILNTVAEKKFPNIPIKPVLDLDQEEIDKKWVLIGTLFKIQTLKPSILKDISEEHALPPQPLKTYCSADDWLMLEDEVQRIRLKSTILKTEELSIGTIVAVMGHRDKGGNFIVEDFCFAEAPAQILPPPPPLENDRWLILASGLDIENNASALLSLQLFIDWLSGFVGGDDDQKGQSQVVRLVLTGNTFSSRKKVNSEKRTYTFGKAGEAAASERVKILRELDRVLHEIATVIPVDVMPGEFDPSNHMIPQQPMHYCMFPKANKLESFQGVTNPYGCLINGRHILGTSGQPIDDLVKTCSLGEPLDILEHTLRWRHLAPTCPDTLAAYPYEGKDPLVIENRPQVYFAGNQPSFATKLLEPKDGLPIRLVCIPRFVETRQCVLVNLRTLDCQTIAFASPPSLEE